MIMCSEADIKKFFLFKTDNLEKLGVWFHHSPNIKKHTRLADLKGCSGFCVALNTQNTNTHKTGRFERLQRVLCCAKGQGGATFCESAAKSGKRSIAAAKFSIFELF